MSVTSRYRDALVKQAASLKPDTVLAGLDILASAKARMRGSAHGRVLVEMALVRLARLDDLVPLAQLAEWLDRSGSAGSADPKGKAGNAGGTASADSRSVPGTPSPRPATLAEHIKKKEREAASPSSPPAPVSLSPETLSAIWQQVLAQVGTIIASHLGRAGLPAITAPNTLVLRFPPQYNSERKYCEEPERLARMMETLRRVAGPACQLRIEANRILGQDSPAPAVEQPAAAPARQRQPLSEAEKEPLIQRAMEVLGARFIRDRVDEGFAAVSGQSEDRAATVNAEEA